MIPISFKGSDMPPSESVPTLKGLRAADSRGSLHDTRPSDQ
jgi:hypothetical protein